MRGLSIIGGAVLAGAVVPALAVATPSTTPVAVTAPTVTYTQGHMPKWTPSYSPVPNPAPAAKCTAGTLGFTPSTTTAPGVYATTCTVTVEIPYSFDPTTPGKLTVLPALTVTRVPALIVGGGQLPLEVTVESPVTLTVTLKRGSTTITYTKLISAGHTLVRTPLRDRHGNRLPGGTYALTVAATNSGATTTKHLSAVIGSGGPTTEVSLTGLPGGHLQPALPLTFEYSQPVAGTKAYRPSFSPPVAGRWSTRNPYETVFTPTGFGFASGSTETFTAHYSVWAASKGHLLAKSVPTVSRRRAEQLLAQLAYLPLKFTPTKPVARTAAGQADAATAPPKGRYTWRYRNTPSALKSLWKTDSSVMMQGAVKAFENDHGLPTDGVIGPAVFRTLELAAISGTGNHFGYSFVHVYRGLPEHLVVWHNGVNAYTALVNTGIAGRETNYGVFPIYLREADGTMSGTNPNGTTYHDTGILWISYFSGGDALHEFQRRGYGYPQSLGCVEMTTTSAHRVWQLTEIGTLVDTLS